MNHPDLEPAVRANHELFMRTSDRIAAPLAAHGLTHATAQALWAIDPDEKPPSMKVMAERLFCNAPNLTFVAGQLADQGLVERAVDPADRRSRVLMLTERGKRVRAEVIRVTFEQTPFAWLNPEELAAVADLLRKALSRNHSRTP
ncbi:MarR family winged helix-turn-helix transcriptional regulator [Winogradskya humida]|uniref:DNA-binding protein n=1 Tax=Winogradskya humida TaxID=113566 RepID=A0ABQ3ZYU4_9ACTN|nr:MarR family transcriptional regulator [Actinoplanes humidus]GIE23317.1 DNA-binding protein [Actinoplanes humidus]